MRAMLAILGIVTCIESTMVSIATANELSDVEQIEFEIRIRESSEKSYKVAYERALTAIEKSSIGKQAKDIANKSGQLRDEVRRMRARIVEENGLVAGETTGLPKSCFEVFKFLSPEYDDCEEKYTHVFSLARDDPEARAVEIEADRVFDELINLHRKAKSIREKFTEKFYLEEMRKELGKLQLEISEEVLDKIRKQFLVIKKIET